MSILGIIGIILAVAIGIFLLKIVLTIVFWIIQFVIGQFWWLLIACFFVYVVINLI